MSSLLQYSFITVAIGTMLLAAATGMIGTLGILGGKSLMGDVVGHAALPGIILAFMIARQRSSIVLMIGAMLSGLFAFFIIQVMSMNAKVEADTVMAIVLSAMFGLGMVLKSYIQGNASYQNVSQAGLRSYIFGQAAYILQEDIYIIFFVSSAALILFFIYYKEIKIYVFDPVYAETLGIRKDWMNTVMMLMTMLLIAAGLKAVGSILISSMLIAPAVTALQWSGHYSKVLLIAALTGMVCAFTGTAVSTVYQGFSTGPSIILAMTAVALASILVSPKGVLYLWFTRRKRM